MCDSMGGSVGLLALALEQTVQGFGIAFLWLRWDRTEWARTISLEERTKQETSPALLCSVTGVEERSFP